jgi:hypothetical protein
LRLADSQRVEVIFSDAKHGYRKLSNALEVALSRIVKTALEIRAKHASKQEHRTLRNVGCLPLNSLLLEHGAG